MKLLDQIVFDFSRHSPVSCFNGEKNLLFSSILHVLDLVLLPRQYINVYRRLFVIEMFFDFTAQIYCSVNYFLQVALLTLTATKLLLSVVLLQSDGLYKS